MIVRVLTHADVYIDGAQDCTRMVPEGKRSILSAVFLPHFLLQRAQVTPPLALRRSRMTCPKYTPVLSMGTLVNPWIVRAPSMTTFPLSPGSPKVGLCQQPPNPCSRVSRSAVATQERVGPL